MGIFKKASVQNDETLDKGLEKTRRGLFSRLTRAIAGKSTISETELDDIEEALITSDVGVDTTLRIINRLEKRIAKDKYLTSDELSNTLCEEIVALLAESKDNNDQTRGNIDAKDVTKPYVMLIVGVNGTGKTTTIGKLAWRYRQSGKTVFLGAADTFRAAATEQLVEWGKRTGSTVICRGQGEDPASVAYDTLMSAKAHNADVVIVDTAGRLHNKIGLMNELKKIKDVMGKAIPGTPHEVLLVLDGSTGQNAFEQAKQFSAVTNITSLVITKLDGTAKGGVVIGISDNLKVPVKFIGVGEKVEDLLPFDRKQFVESLFLR